jgi:hypothetical protein
MQAAHKFVHIDMWGRTERENTHLVLIEREHELASSTPPARVTLRQCSSRRGKQSLRRGGAGLVLTCGASLNRAASSRIP